MTLTVELSPEQEYRLRLAAEQAGQDLSTYVLETLEQQLEQAGIPSSEEARRKRALQHLEEWMSQPADPEEAVGYPTEITPLSLREVEIRIDHWCVGGLVATENVGHLARFVPADNWRNFR